jgi:hypothetical protein
LEPKKVQRCRSHFFGHEHENNPALLACCLN